MPHHNSHSHRFSYTYTNTSSSFSSFTSTSTSSTPSSTALARRSSTTRLKRWLSNRLPLRFPSAVTRQSSSATATAAGTNSRERTGRRNSHYDIYNRKVSYPGCAYTECTDSRSDSDSNAQFDSTVKIPGNHGYEQGQGQGNEQEQEHNYFRSFDFDYEYDAANTNTSTYRNHTSREAQGQDQAHPETLEEEENEDDLTLSDNYAAYCRAFTASPVLIHRSQPLPCLPPSDPESWDDLQTGKGASDSAYDNHQLGESASDAHLHTDMRAHADESQIGFLPVGAHGYRPAQWGRVPSPPPGILTPARYEAIQMLERERMEIEKLKRRKRFPSWCMPIRLFVWPWGRSKQC